VNNFIRGNGLKKHIPFIIFLVLFVGIGFSIYRDYGVSWDEKAQIDLGRVNYQYLTKGNPALLTDTDRFHGPLFEIPLWRLTVQLPNPDMIYARHLDIFFIFVIGVIALYILACRLFHSSWWSLLTAILLVSSPRIFADSFYNSKDIPFLVFFTIAILSWIFLIDVIWSDRTWEIKIGAVVLSALTCAWAVDIRIPGIVLIPLTCILFMLVILCKPKHWRVAGVLFVTYLILSTGFIILFWPSLWHDPIHEFINAFVNMDHFTWNGTVLSRGPFIQAVDLPWHYIPTWILITTPLLQLGGFVLGIFSLIIVSGNNIRYVFSKSMRSFLDSFTPDTFAWLAIAMCLVVPLATVIMLHSVLYDGWRQMYFIYPSILLIAVFGMKTVYKQSSRVFRHPIWLRILAGMVLAIGLLEPLVFALQYHPHENVFFNVFAGNSTSLRQKFEQDYWGLSYKQGIDYILAHDQSSKIYLAINDKPGNEYIEYMLTPEQASRIVIGPVNSSDYFITTFRWHPEDYSYGKEYYSINIRGTTIMVVYKIK